MIGIDSVEPVGRFVSAMFGDIVGESHGVQPASAQAETLAERFCGLEEFVRYRKGNFHTVVLPRYEYPGKLLPARTSTSFNSQVAPVVKVRPSTA